MSILSLEGVSKAFGAKTILEKVTLQLQPGEKAGLIGPNGAGKTTLLRIITGELAADNGTVALTRGATIGYLPQKPDFPAGGTLQEFLEEPLQHLLRMQREMAALEEAIALCSRNGDPDLNRLLARYGEMSTLFKEQGGYQVHSKIKAVALGLGFRGEDLERPIMRFSGGEKTRALLAALLLREPDLLLLDEPTNYLDTGGLEWLEKYLQEWRRALLVVSHDRFFLDRVAEKIFHLHQGHLKGYAGNYSSFRRHYEQERITLEKAFHKQQDLLAKEERFIREAKGDERSKRQARSREKRLKKLKPVDRITDEPSFNLKFEYSGRSGRRVLLLKNVDKAYGQKTLFRNVSFELFWGERAALVGPNGSGKSTLLKLVAGEEQPTRGEVRLGAAVKAVYFSQQQEQLKSGQTLLECIMEAADLTVPAARKHLGRYLFRGDDVFKKVSQLSGGEKSRLALARLSLEKGNLLLMDEPTSHLDMPALEELEEALQSYPGTLLVVSHDRFFLDKLVNRVFEIKDGELLSFQGAYREFLQARAAAATAPAVAGKRRLREPDRRREEQEQRKRLSRMQKDLAGLEEAIEAAEQHIDSLERQLSDPDVYEDFQRARELAGKLEAEKQKLAALLAEWEELGLRLEAEGNKI